MQEKYKLFKEKISDYLEIHKGEKVLFPVFVNLANRINFKETKKDLTTLTSKIINNLIKEGKLKEVPKKFENVYGMYKIL